MSHRDGWTPAAAARRTLAVAVFAVTAAYAAEGLALGYDYVRQLRLPHNYDRRTRLEVLSDPRAQGLDAMTSPSSPEGNRLVADAVLDDITPEPNESTAPPH